MKRKIFFLIFCAISTSLSTQAMDETKHGARRKVKTKDKTEEKIVTILLTGIFGYHRTKQFEKLGTATVTWDNENRLLKEIIISSNTTPRQFFKYVEKENDRVYCGAGPSNDELLQPLPLSETLQPVANFAKNIKRDYGLQWTLLKYLSTLDCFGKSSESKTENTKSASIKIYKNPKNDHYCKDWKFLEGSLWSSPNKRLFLRSIYLQDSSQIIQILHNIHSDLHKEHPEAFPKAKED